tara:strand:- start:1087 stop:1302 length:216 start_codon:yes stop_codon:yes gene_type:complete
MTEEMITTILMTLLVSALVLVCVNEYRSVLKWRREQLLAIRKKQASIEFKLNNIESKLEKVLNKVNDRAYS